MSSIFLTKEQEDLDIITNSKIEWETYQNSTVLVTGATGLIGSLLVKSFLCYNKKNNGNISVLAVVRNINKAYEVFKEYRECIGLKFVIGDIVEDLVIEEEINYIFHCASITASKIMVEHPVLTINTAYEGTKKIFELAATKRIKGMVYVSSMEVYGRTDEKLEKVTENDLGYIDLTNVRSCYSEGKRICECLCTAYASEYQIPVRVARLAQTFGAGIHADDNRVYAQFARSALKGENIVLHTDGMSEGNYCYTRDVIIALLFLAYSGKNGEAYNIVNEKSHMTIKEMASLVADDIMEGKIKVIYDIPNSDKVYGYAPSVKMHLSAKKMKSLGWVAEVDMKEAYMRMINDLKVL